MKQEADYFVDGHDYASMGEIIVVTARDWQATRSAKASHFVRSPAAVIWQRTGVTSVDHPDATCTSCMNDIAVMAR